MTHTHTPANGTPATGDAAGDHAAHAHAHAGARDTTAADQFGRAYWEDRYSAPERAWSGNPNPVLVTEASGLTPSTAIDIGSGEGGDALWLASAGWAVTGVDIADNALAKAKALAEEADPAAAARITWSRHDVSEWAPEPRSFGLVSAQFMHLAEPRRSELFRALAAAVAPGGTLLIVGHDIAADEAEGNKAHMLDLLFGADDVVTAIDGEGLRVTVAESRPRAAAAAGHETPMRDVVVVAVRDN